MISLVTAKETNCVFFSETKSNDYNLTLNTGKTLNFTNNLIKTVFIKVS